jgi:hypothetical protein
MARSDGSTLALGVVGALVIGTALTRRGSFARLLAAKTGTLLVRGASPGPDLDFWQVDEADPKGQWLAVSPAGGGFRRKIRAATIAAEGFRRATPDDLLPRWRPGRFSFEGGDIYKGFTRGRLWNGWAMPAFEKDETRAIVAWLTEHEGRSSYDAPSDTFTWYMDEGAAEDERYTATGEDILVQGRRHHVYDFGGLGLTLMEED